MDTSWMQINFTEQLEKWWAETLEKKPDIDSDYKQLVPVVIWKAKGFDLRVKEFEEKDPEFMSTREGCLYMSKVALNAADMSSSLASLGELTAWKIRQEERKSARIAEEESLKRERAERKERARIKQLEKEEKKAQKKLAKLENGQRTKPLSGAGEGGTLAGAGEGSTLTGGQSVAADEKQLPDLEGTEDSEDSDDSEDESEESEDEEVEPYYEQEVDFLEVEPTYGPPQDPSFYRGKINLTTSMLEDSPNWGTNKWIYKVFDTVMKAKEMTHGKYTMYGKPSKDGDVLKLAVDVFVRARKRGGINNYHYNIAQGKDECRVRAVTEAAMYGHWRMATIELKTLMDTEIPDFSENFLYFTKPANKK